MKSQIVRSCGLVAGAHGAVAAAERHEQVWILRHTRPESAFIPVLATQVAFVHGRGSRRTAIGSGRHVHFGPEGSFLWSRGRESLCFGILLRFS